MASVDKKFFLEAESENQNFATIKFLEKKMLYMLM